jgi:biopolymer transport protein ExbD
MAVKVRGERQSHRFHSMKLLSSDGGGGKSADVHLNIVPLVDMMMVLVIFLVMNFNATGEMLFLSQDMEMVRAENGLEITRVPIVSVSFNPDSQSRWLYFEGEQIYNLDELLNDDTAPADWLIAELEEKLVENREVFEAIGGAERAAGLAPEQDPTTTVNVQVDLNTPYKLLKRVLYSCEQAGYGRIRLTVGDNRKANAGAPEGEALAVE